MPLQWLTHKTAKAIDLLSRSQKEEYTALAIEVNFVTPAVSRHIHREYLDDDTPTDVITFPHGEIFICPEVASRQAMEFGSTLPHETLLYIIHALLHLQGWRDDTTVRQRRMAQMQENILKRVLAAKKRKSRKPRV